MASIASIGICHLNHVIAVSQLGRFHTLHGMFWITSWEAIYCTNVLNIPLRVLNIKLPLSWTNCSTSWINPEAIYWL